jgi:hypothetical protein
MPTMSGWFGRGLNGAYVISRVTWSATERPHQGAVPTQNAAGVGAQPVGEGR